MKIIREIDVNNAEFPEDVERIKRILLERGYRATCKQCEELWEAYSDSMCAGWMYLDEDDEDVFNNIRSRISL